MTFLEELQHLINRHSKEHTSNTPDFILAQFLLDSLVMFEIAIQQRERWYGRDATPGHLGTGRLQEGEHG